MLSNKGMKLKKLFGFYSLLIFVFSDVLEQFFKCICLTLISGVWREDFTFISFALLKKNTAVEVLLYYLRDINGFGIKKKSILRIKSKSCVQVLHKKQTTRNVLSQVGNKDGF